MLPAPRLAVGLLLLVAACLSPSAVRAENWPNWRGPDYDGISSEKGLPTEWSESKNVAWTLPMPGVGSSTPVVWGDRLFLTSEEGEGDLVLLCVSTAGKELWKRKLGANKRRARGDEGNDASNSPSTDGKHVYAMVGTGDLAAFDFDGKELWKANLQDRYGKFKIQFGMHSTPLLYEGKLYLQLIHSGGAHVVCLDAADGKEVWKISRASDGRDECEHSYASPTLWKKGGEALLIVHGNDYATAHRLKDGSEVWRVGGLNPKDRYNPTLRFVASPVAVGELVVVPSAKNGPVVGLKPSASGLVVGGKSELWRLPNGTPDVPSPLVVDGLVYLVRENGNMACLDARSGKVHYTDQRTQNTRHRASPVFADGKIYTAARDGTVCVVAAGPEFKLLAKNKLPDDFNASPAISGGRIYLRGFKNLYAVSEGGK
jgi:outer membrane protein assembly factor BamB